MTELQRLISQAARIREEIEGLECEWDALMVDIVRLEDEKDQQASKPA